MTAPSSLRAAPMRTTTIVLVGIALLLASGVAIWWYGPWNEVARYNRMPLLALHRLADDQPHNAVAWHILALKLARDGDADLAEPALRQALELNPNDGMAAAGLSQLLISTGRLDEAFQILKQTAGRAPHNLTVRLELGRLYQRKGAAQHAAAEYEAVTAMDARNADAWYLLAECYYNMQKLGQAQDAIHRALTLQANNPQYLTFSAMLAAASGHAEDAIATARKSASLAPDDVTIQANFVAMLLQHQHSKDEIREAETTIGRLEQIAPNYPPLSSLRGDLEAAQGHWEAAARYYQKATEALPDSNHAYYVLARAYRQLGRSADAERFEKIYARRQSLLQQIDGVKSEIGGKPRNAGLYERLSAAELEYGHRAEAISALETALAISPGNPEIQKRLSKLQYGASLPSLKQ